MSKFSEELAAIPMEERCKECKKYKAMWSGKCMGCERKGCKPLEEETRKPKKKTDKKQNAKKGL